MQAQNPTTSNPNRIAKSQQNSYYKKRTRFYFFTFLLAFFLPWIRINDNHFILLSFDHKKLNLLFTSFNTNELYLLPFCLILMFAFIFFITTLLGRVWCAWACPQTIFRVIYRDLLQTKIFKIFAGRKNKQNPPRAKSMAKFFALLAFVPIALIAASNFLWYFIPPEDFFSYLKTPSEHMLLVGMIVCIAGFLVFDITFIKENFCSYICPYARIQSVMLDNDSKIVIYDESRGGLIYKGAQKITKKPIGGECIGCEACVKICPTHIDIRRGMQLDCINCLECSDACSAVQARFNRPSLINWTSTNANVKKQKIKYLRAKTIGYALFMCLIFSILLIKAQDKSVLLLNINRAGELYKIDKNKVSNSYTMLFQNTDSKEHEIYFETNNEQITILQPSKSFKLSPGKFVKKIVSLQADCGSMDEENQLIIKAYALDDNTVIATQKTTFNQPKSSECHAKK